MRCADKLDDTGVRRETRQQLRLALEALVARRSQRVLVEPDFDGDGTRAQRRCIHVARRTATEAPAATDERTVRDKTPSADAVQFLCSLDHNFVWIERQRKRRANVQFECGTLTIVDNQLDVAVKRRCPFAFN